MTTTLTEQVTQQLLDNKANDIKLLDLRKFNSITAFMLLCSATSTRHAKAIADRLVEHFKKQNIYPLGVEGEQASEWILVDYGDVVVHIMLPRTREFYSLERIWQTDLNDKNPSSD